MAELTAARMTTGADPFTVPVAQITGWGKEECLDLLLALATGRDTNYNDVISILVREELDDLRQLRDKAIAAAILPGLEAAKPRVGAALARYADASRRRPPVAALMGCGVQW